MFYFHHAKLKRTPSVSHLREHSTFDKFCPVCGKTGGLLSAAATAVPTATRRGAAAASCSALQRAKTGLPSASASYGRDAGLADTSRKTLKIKMKNVSSICASSISIWFCVFVQR